MAFEPKKDFKLNKKHSKDHIFIMQQHLYVETKYIMNQMHTLKWML